MQIYVEKFRWMPSEICEQIYHQSKPTLCQDIVGDFSISSSESACFIENQRDEERILNILM